uniref:NS3 n=1 Tax=Heramatsu virus TaxID=1416744 RepID=U5XLZ3_9REOV|nr:NS3 [Heramatsu virus]
MQAAYTKFNRESGEVETTMALTPYAPMSPPVYTKTLTGAKEISLGVLDRAMTTTTGADSVLKDEKAAYGAFAEALRDATPIREIKRRVGARVIPRLEGQLRAYQRRYRAAKAVLFVLGCTALASSMMGLAGETETFKTYKEYLHAPVVGTINLLTTSAVVGLNGIVGKMKANIERVRRDLMKRKSYQDASRMPYDATCGVEELV